MTELNKKLFSIQAWLKGVNTAIDNLEYAVNNNTDAAKHMPAFIENIRYQLENAETELNALRKQ